MTRSALPLVLSLRGRLAQYRPRRTPTGPAARTLGLHPATRHSSTGPHARRARCSTAHAAVAR